MCDVPVYVREGDIMKAKPKHFLPRPDGVGSIGQHPVIVLSQPNQEGFVYVTPMSHNHPEGTPTRRASNYGLPVDPVKGESRVNVGQPKLIHLSNLRANNPHTSMSSNDYYKLKAEIFGQQTQRSFNSYPQQQYYAPAYPQTYVQPGYVHPAHY